MPVNVQYKQMADLAVQWLQQGWQAGSVYCIDELHTPDFIDHDPGGRAPDNEGFKQGIIALYQAFPDFKAELTGLAVDCEKNLVTVRWRGRGTHKALYLNLPPTGKTIYFKGIEVLLIRDGRIAERWGEWDGLELIAQMQVC